MCSFKLTFVYVIVSERGCSQTRPHEYARVLTAASYSQTRRDEYAMIFAYYFQWTWIVRTWVIRYTRTTASYNLTTRVRECRLPIHHVTTGMNQFYLLIGLGVNPFHLLIGPYLYRIVCISCFLLFVKCLMCWDRGRPNELIERKYHNTNIHTSV